jgi:hypothetical protein
VTAFIGWIPLHKFCITHRRLNIGRTLYTLAFATSWCSYSLAQPQSTLRPNISVRHSREPRRHHIRVLHLSICTFSIASGALADGSLCRQVLRYTRPHRQAIHPSCIDIGVRSLHSARSAKPRYTDRISFCLWGASGVSSILCGEDGWKKELFCEVSTLADLAPDYDRGKSGKGRHMVRQ